MRAAVTADHVAPVHLIGNEGDLLIERQRSITTVEDAVTVYYTGGGTGTVWNLAVAALERLGPAEAGQVAPELPREAVTVGSAGTGCAGPRPP